MRSFHVVVALVCVVGVTSAASGLDITACGTMVPAGEVGVLVTDLDCSGLPASWGVRLGEGATLTMNGHTVKGAAEGVRCFERRCTVTGPGTLFENGVGIVVQMSRIVVENINIHDNGYGIAGHAGAYIEAIDVITNDNATSGIQAPIIRATNVTANGNVEYGLIAVKRLRGEGVTTSGNGEEGIESLGPASLTNFVATGNGGPGIAADRRVRLVGSTVTGNGTLGDGIDIAAHRRPRLVDTTCGRSSNPDTSASWDVCSGD